MARKKDVNIEIGATITGLNKKLKQARVQIKAALSSGKNVNTSLKSFEKVEKQLNRVKSAVRPAQVAFQGWALSLMFFGQALKGLFDTIWRESTKVFNDIMHSVEGTVTGFDMLGGSLTFLKFLAGEALEPIAMFLIPVVDAISDWIEKNPELFRTLTIIIGVLGTFFTILGAGALAIVNGFIPLWGILSTAFQGAAAAMGVSGGAIILIIGAIIAVVVWLKAVWDTNLGNIQSMVKENFAIIWNTIKGVVMNIMGIFSGLFKVLKGVMTGDFELVWEGLVQIFKNFISLIVKLALGMGAAIINVFIFVFNFIKDTMFNIASLITGAIKAVVSLAEGIPGASFIVNGLDKALDALDKFKEAQTISSISADSIKGLTTGFDEFLFGDPKKEETKSTDTQPAISIGNLTLQTDESTTVEELLKIIKASS